MTGYIMDSRGRAHLLPALLSWDVSHTTGRDSGSFSVSFLYEAAMLPVLKQACRFRGYHDGETVFYGVVDRYVVTCDGRGRLVKLQGRSLAALLMDNEAESGDYYNVDLEYILRRHVTPWGVTDVAPAAAKPLARFTVRSGQSEWSVLREYLEFSGGFTPRFTPEGRLLCDGSQGGRTVVIGGGTPVVAAEFADDRCGVISQMLVKKTRGGSGVVENPGFIARGGCARQVLNVPRYLSYDAMRYTGEYQIRKSREDSVTLTLTVPELFAAFAGDTVRLDKSPVGLTGRFRVAGSRCWAAGEQYGTELTLSVWEEW